MWSIYKGSLHIDVPSFNEWIKYFFIFRVESTNFSLIPYDSYKLHDVLSTVICIILGILLFILIVNCTRSVFLNLQNHFLTFKNNNTSNKSTKLTSFLTPISIVLLISLTFCYPTDLRCERVPLQLKSPKKTRELNRLVIFFSFLNHLLQLLLHFFKTLLLWELAAFDLRRINILLFEGLIIS